MNSPAIFTAELSRCCKGRVRVRVGNKKLCLDWLEAKRVGLALKDLSKQARDVQEGKTEWVAQIDKALRSEQGRKMAGEKKP